MSLELYSKGVRVWVRDPEAVWKSAVVFSELSDKSLHIRIDDSAKEQTLSVSDEADLPPLRNPDILVGKNDLTTLSHLHEPAVLHNLRVRFCQHSAIYTYCGIVLVAINPYQDLPIFGPETIWAYRGRSLGDLDPHIFAIAEEAFTQMERLSRDQSIIVSGESGAGKTVSAKFAMRYFATVGGSSSNSETQVERKVLASNPIMEAIGNAKTIRNDNSSRFGKFIQIMFNKRYHIYAASMRTYLLEKSRVVYQANGERNYHIFYQMCAARHSEQLTDLGLEDQTSYEYLNQGDCCTIEGVDDAERFATTCRSLALVGIDGHVQNVVLRVLAAVLHLGNVRLVETVSAGEECCSVARDDSSLPLVSRLLAIDHEQIRHWLCRRKIVSSREVFTKPMSKMQAASARDALAKHIYSRLFNWIVERINLCLVSHETAFRFIGILDIYGFETFEVNSFEQFCINYANEKLQQQFNQHVFKLEQEEYVREKIEWTFIDFYDNQPCLDLIEAKLGVLDLLDDECRMPRGSDESWAQKLYQQCGRGRFEHFEKPRLSNTAFIVAHFAARVEYQTDGFLEKNRDTVQQEHTDVLLSSLNPIVAGLFETTSAVKVKKPVKLSAPAKPSSANKRTVGQQFRESLGMLMSTLSATTPHYVRCIKPNDEKSAFVFDPARSVQQLRACGVLETIRISAAGYPSRWVCEEFFLRYRVLCHSKDIVRGDIRATCEVILKRFIKMEDKFRFGLTKVFLRAGQVAFLEKLRADRLRDCALMIQRHVRGWMQRRRYATLRGASGTLQRFVRGFLARRRVERIRRHRASICLQRHVRGWLSRVRYNRLLRATVCLQALARGKLARLRYDRLRRERAAVTIQRYVRGWLQRLTYALWRRRIVLLQCCVRRLIAHRELKARKIQARSLDHQRQLNKGLENKIISMQQRITELTGECTTLRRRAVDSESQLAGLHQLRQESAALKAQAARVDQLQKQLEQLREHLDHERCEKVDIVNQMDQLKVSVQEQLQTASAETSRLADKLAQSEQLRQQAEMKTEELVSASVKTERSRLTSEYEEDRLGYQKLVQQNSQLERRCELLHKQLQQQQQRLEIPASHRPGSSASGGVTDFSDSDRVTPEIGEIFAGSQLSSEMESGDYGSEKDAAVTKQTFVAEDQEEKDVDLSLVMKLQARLREAEDSRNELASRLEAANDSPGNDDSHIVYDRIKMQSLEMDNAKLKNDLEKLRSAVAQNSAQETLTAQFETVQDELERRREECIHLRAMITNSAVAGAAFMAGGVRQHTCDISDQEEISMAFETQKQINRQIADELHREKAERVQLLQQEADTRVQLQQLRENSCREQEQLAELLQTAGAKPSAVLQHELVRLNNENLELRGSNETLQKKAAKLKQQLKIYAKRYKDASGVAVEKQVECLGMLEYQCKDEEKLIKTLITDLRPEMAKDYVIGLPAHIIFMCVRHMDHCDDANKVYSFMSRVVRAVKRVTGRNKNDIGMQLLWLVNLCRLLNFMKEFSGDDRFQSENSDLQVNQSLRNFDLSEFRYLLNDLAVITYQTLCNLLCEMVQKLVVPALLDHQALPNLPGSSSSSGPSSSVSSAAWSGTLGVLGSTVRQLRRTASNQQQLEEEAMSQLLAKLRWIKQLLTDRGVEPLIAGQIFRQVMYFLCAHALNTLLLRRELCTWSRGLQIRFNLSHLEQWAREQCPPAGPDAAGADDALRPIVQASQLLQSRKTQADIETLCSSCERLSAAQIIKLLNMFSPDECEERLTESFMTNVQEYLISTRPPESFDTVMMDVKHLMAVRFPYSPSRLSWSSFNIPSSLGLTMLRKI